METPCRRTGKDFDRFQSFQVWGGFLPTLSIFSVEDFVITRALVLFFFLFTLGISPGCSKRGSSEPTRGALFGKITVKGVPLAGGDVIFKTKDGKDAGTAKVNTDGTYQAGLPLGEVLVGVDTENFKKMIEAKPAGIGGLPTDPREMEAFMNKFKDKKWTEEERQKYMAEEANKQKNIPTIPEKYRDPAKSGFSLTIQAGKQEMDFNIPE
jgi:hypothetical protein